MIEESIHGLVFFFFPPKNVSPFKFLNYGGKMLCLSLDKMQRQQDVGPSQIAVGWSVWV